MKNIVLFLPNWIGDVVMATPSLMAVRAQYPQAHLVAVCRSYVAALLDGSPWFNSILLADKKSGWSGQYAAIRQLRRLRPEAAVLYPNSFRSALMAWLGGCLSRVGFARSGRSWLLTHRLKPHLDERGGYRPTPIIDDYNRLVMALGVPDPGHTMRLFTTPDHDQAAAKLWQEERLGDAPAVVGINTGGAFGSAKQWPLEYFVQLAQRFRDEQGWAVLILCGPSEREVARAIVQKAARPLVVSLADRTLSLGFSKSCVQKLDLLVSTDSGPRHFAAAFDRPVVSLFGPTFIDWTDTFYPREIMLQEKVPCGPCQQRECHLDHRCMKNLSVARVYQAALSLLGHRAEKLRGQRHAS